MVIHQPVLRLGIEQPLIGDVSGVRDRQARDQRRTAKRGKGAGRPGTVKTQIAGFERYRHGRLPEFFCLIETSSRGHGVTMVAAASRRSA
jgi:hypothetical protein